MIPDPSEQEEFVANTEPTGRPAVTVDGKILADDAVHRLRRVVVDNDLHLPGMFELTFMDNDGLAVSKAGIQMGSEVTVIAVDHMARACTLIVGDVTAIEGQVQGMTLLTVVRGYCGAHRLQRARRSRSFMNVTDADVANLIAGQNGLTIGEVVATSTTHSYLAQVNQTDWEFLQARAREIGFEMGVENGRFYFRPGVNSFVEAGGGKLGMARSLLQMASGAMSAVTVQFPDDLLSFRPRFTAGNLTPDVEVRVWDPMARTASAHDVSTPAEGVDSAAYLGGMFTSGGLGSALDGAMQQAEGVVDSLSLSGLDSAVNTVEGSVNDTLAQASGGLLGSPVGFLGPTASPTAHIVVDRPIANDDTIATEGPMVARALGTDFGSTYAECEGEARGNAAIQPNVDIDVQGVQGLFTGKWQVSRARHVFDDSEYGYRVIFSAHGRQDRTMLGLTSKGTRSSDRNPVLSGVVCGVVSDCNDPLAKGRVKATLPWLSPTFETDWAPNIQFCSGPRSGAIFMPEIGDEVLIAFEFGDVRRPYVLGGMMNNFTQWSIAKSGPIFAGGLAGLATEGMMMGGQMAGAALGGMVAGPLGGMAGAALGGELAREAGNEAVEAVSGNAIVPGMVSEVHHRGFVSSTGNALLFYDVPMIPPLPTAADVGSVTGADLDAGGGTSDGGIDIVDPAAGALASAVRIGAQTGETAVTIDQVSAGINITASPVLGAPESILPNINIVAQNGFLNMAVGEEGSMLIDGGAALFIKSATAITLDAPTINIVGLPLINGVPIPL
ncbi:phage baseplate assembly protein V [Labedaea rhizosphaerae]|uniref:Gp5/Type VI secretion system Vgr protein OB-fold domain-containing protein n=1 Tax=Labedaea rhizosphaerae TaxID=598644 RepID=A0A4R6SII2_LABRH|nr:phage baseplate assembly protein V [Labedaea rhizosphaerae]TDQ00788.1 hypothetical protein EV186_102654 [Labedaea rhizosphaerae]